MSTAIIGTGNIGKAVAQHLVDGGEEVILASLNESDDKALAHELGAKASAATVAEAISQADTIVLAIWLDDIKKLIADHGPALVGKVVVDPSSPVGTNDKGEFGRTLPDGVSAGSVVAGLLPPGVHYVKAFGTLSAPSLASAANRQPRRVVLFFATDDEKAAETAVRLISAAGFDPVKAGGVDSALQIEMGGALHESGGLDGRLLDRDEAEAALALAVAA
jgi:predicted dinucleotide-binding enzyme